MEIDLAAMILNLRKLSCGDDANFSLTLNDGSLLNSHEIVRRVPNKRLVCRAHWNGQAVFAKLFIGKQAARYAKRDSAGIQALHQAGITTPSLLFAGHATEPVNDDEPVCVLIFVEIPRALNAEQAMQEYAQNTQLRLTLARQLVAEVAHHHHSGLLQTDLYLKNFLVTATQLFTLDGDGIKPLRVLFSRQQALGNLAILISKLDVLDQSNWLEELVREYARVRGWGKLPDLKRIEGMATHHREAVASQYAEKKVFRQCSDVHVEQVRGDFLAISRPWFKQPLLQALTAPDRLLESTEAIRIKTGNTCTVSLVDVNDRKVVIKRYNIKSVWHGLSRALRQTRASTSWANAHRLNILDIATAAPVALYERRFGLVRRHSYFLAEYIEAPDVGQFFSAADIPLSEKSAAAAHLATLFYKLRLLKIAHGDFKASNIKIVDNKPVLIDLDSLRQHRCPWLFDKRHVRDLRRFFRNWADDPVTEQLLSAAFILIYKETYNETKLLFQAGIKFG